MAKTKQLFSIHHILRGGRHAACYALLCLLLVFSTRSAWSLDPPHLIICSGDFPPYNSPKVAKQGPVIEISVEAFRRSGVATEVVFMPWARILKEGENAKCAILGIWRNSQRDQQFDYTLSILEQELGFFVRRNSSYKTSDTEQGNKLAKLVIGVERGSYVSPVLEGKGYTFDIANSLLLNLRKLAKGRIDLAYGNKASGEYMINAEADLRGQLIWVSPALESKAIYLAFSKNHPNKDQLIEAYNLGLSSMKADGSFKKTLANAKLLP